MLFRSRVQTMDIQRVIFHTKELLELRGEDGVSFQNKIDEFELNVKLDDP